VVLPLSYDGRDGGCVYNRFNGTRVLENKSPEILRGEKTMLSNAYADERLVRDLNADRAREANHERLVKRALRYAKRARAKAK
jgi:hypothetical protein